MKKKREREREGKERKKKSITTLATKYTQTQEAEAYFWSIFQILVFFNLFFLLCCFFFKTLFFSSFFNTDLCNYPHFLLSDFYVGGEQKDWCLACNILLNNCPSNHYAVKGGRGGVWRLVFLYILVSVQGWESTPWVPDIMILNDCVENAADFDV